MPGDVFADAPTPTPYRYYFPAVSAVGPIPPLASASRYITTLDSTTLYNRGCQQGSERQAGIIVLDFGAPRISSGESGTKLVGVAGFVSTTQIAEAVRWWLQGYWNCAPSNAHVTVALGTNNCGYIPGQAGCLANSTNITREHGVAWHQLVKSVNDWVITSTYASKFTIAGANDIELSWSGPQETRAWVDGYFAAGHDFALYNFGACDGCPYLASQNWVLPNGWTKEDVWYVSWGASTAYPLPEIYLTNGWNASQWYLMSVWAFNTHGSPMVMSGAMTQWQACQDVGGCTSTDNTPAQGWLQLYNMLNADARTAQPLKWSTDITWQQ